VAVGAGLRVQSEAPDIQSGRGRRRWLEARGSRLERPLQFVMLEEPFVCQTLIDFTVMGSFTPAPRMKNMCC